MNIKQYIAGLIESILIFACFLGSVILMFDLEITDSTFRFIIGAALFGLFMGILEGVIKKEISKGE